MGGGGGVGWHGGAAQLLEKHTAWCRFGDRQHPEEFAVRYLTGPTRSMWGVPKRNSLFTGREKAMGRLQRGLAEGTGADVRSGVSQMVVVGLGGVGKTQLATEFCYRHYGTYYGLVMWLRAEIQETIEGDILRLAADTGLEVKDRPTEEVIEEVKAQLYRCQCPWLMVFDNLEDEDMLMKYAPRGGKHGHILITTRCVPHRMSHTRGRAVGYPYAPRTARRRLSRRL
jgi:hypothetical protein